jgi:hypothetical protein
MNMYLQVAISIAAQQKDERKDISGEKELGEGA